ncbi:Rha family transcriptional regulator [Candidatus Pantoea persica]|uniref:Rha family transcriptional regulator n=1 Tax=Candidatus Pantoea persica TaxID=2518128 RepID=UPI00215D95F0|nr:Rha family transcriptional regulator [Candidatus Pantoea persica]MBA2815342.1 phage regulatory protein, Rha family [Candidatus Pantoea persica]
MQNLTIAQTLTMSSREIAELTEKQHKNVKRDIEKMLVELGEDTLSFEHIYLDSMNRQQTEYLLDRDHTECLLTGYSAIQRMRVIKRWHELEERASQFTIPQTYPEALRLAAELAEETQQLKLINKEQEAEIHDLKSLFKEVMTPIQFCKMLNGVNTQKVNQWLAERNWLYNESQSGTRWRATSYARDKYLTEHQHLTSVHGADDFIKHQPVLLRKGAERLYVLYRRGKVPMKLNWNGDFTHQKHVSLAS